MAVFIVIFFSFCGALTLSLCYSGSSENRELRCVAVEYISLTKLWSCTGKNISHRFLQVSNIFENFYWNLFNLICSLLVRFCIYLKNSRPFAKAILLLLVVLETFYWADFVRCLSSIQWRKIIHLSSRWHYSLKILLLFARNDCIDLSLNASSRRSDTWSLIRN